MHYLTQSYSCKNEQQTTIAKTKDKSMIKNLIDSNRITGKELKILVKAFLSILKKEEEQKESDDDEFFDDKNHEEYDPEDDDIDKKHKKQKK
jgi:hypothetical protein